MRSGNPEQLFRIIDDDDDPADDATNPSIFPLKITHVFSIPNLIFSFFA